MVLCLVYETVVPRRGGADVGQGKAKSRDEPETWSEPLHVFCTRGGKLILWNTSLFLDQIRHVYLGKAHDLRPDLKEVDS